MYFHAELKTENQTFYANFPRNEKFCSKLDLRDLSESEQNVAKVTVKMENVLLCAFIKPYVQLC